jgi:hypothetical protein
VGAKDRSAVDGMVWAGCLACKCDMGGRGALACHLLVWVCSVDSACWAHPHRQAAARELCVLPGTNPVGQALLLFSTSQDTVTVVARGERCGVGGGGERTWVAAVPWPAICWCGCAR